MKIINTWVEHGTLKQLFAILRQRKDIRWILLWLGGLLGLWWWDAVFLNPLAYELIQSALVNTFVGASTAVALSLFIGWSVGIALYFLENGRVKSLHLSLMFILNLIRSVPQIVGLLIGYILLTLFITYGVLQSQLNQILWMAFVISIFCSLEVIDLVTERIMHYRKSDYFHAMLCCGIKESRIINVEILWKNSLSHLLHKLVSLFGVVVLLQCSIDFIISVGLSTDVSLSNFPVTLGSLLAKLDSKQDILAMGSMLVDPVYASRILFQHLQGVSVAFIIVFTLLCVFQIADGLVRQYDL
ncbi:MAG: ABC transporter permease subunit [Ignavibacteriales bacterium]|nr:ABC transporter permease subunit [Ignavibacteriales bacterium]